ncbi:MAG: 1-deoxy-D-xylulose-5-phosphate synthase [Coriobacteriia bacterium]|nr:1-deoxy-D-xylulose-5-phosphate synthase [Coriobacteriia bacterium]MCL2750699.1 1-deoxy-D-xylulose-5-phosphate synthase [Coriobacteriia bacterium]
MDLLQKIESPDDLKALSFSELATLAKQIRERMVEVTAKTGGHLASSLGAVEIILALHRVFDFSTDRLVFDVGHQSYAHKIITGRNANFDTLRQKGGVSGFPKRGESIYDAHNAGHASDSLSIACGMATARDLKGSDEEIVVLIGDASLSGGMAFEALNQIGNDHKNVTIVLNDNEMSISKNVGALSLYLGKVRMSKPYTWTRDTVEGGLERSGRVGHALVTAGEAAKASVKKLVVPGMFFEDIGIKYIGPIDGHHIGRLEDALEAARHVDGPVLIHAVTQKGRGFAPAEALPEYYHGVSPFDPNTGIAINGASATPTYTEIFGAALALEAAENEDIVAITAGMSSGTGLTEFAERFPRRFIDVGIAEEHAVALAAGLALGGKRPVVAMYSTFLQRAYDQLIIDVALQSLPVVFCVDRAGLVGEDGDTHQGVFDLAYLRSIPNLHIIAPYTATDLYLALQTAFAREDGPTVIRYPRGKIPADGALEEYKAAAAAFEEGFEDARTLPLGKSRRLRDGEDLTIMAAGKMVSVALECAALLAEQGVNAGVVDMLWVKPLDTEAVRLAANTGYVVTIEDGSYKGGFGSAVLEELMLLQLTPRVQTFGLPDRFIQHGSQAALFAEMKLTGPDIAQQILSTIR